MFQGLKRPNEYLGLSFVFLNMLGKWRFQILSAFVSKVIFLDF